MASNTQFATAVHVLALLSRQNGRLITSDYIAGSINTNPVVVRRLLSQLSAAGLVVTQTGLNGGSRLAKQANEINLADVYHAINCGQVFALPHREPNRDCPVGRCIEGILCNLQKLIDNKISEELSSLTLKDVLSQIEAEC
jgi:Rrf2 family protein